MTYEIAALIANIALALSFIVALVFSLKKPRAAYLRWKTWVDRFAAGVMAALGLKLIFSSTRP